MTVAYSKPRPTDATLPGRDQAADTREEEAVVDFNLHGLLGIRLVNPSSADIRTVGKQVGLAPRTFDGDPGITIRFEKELPVRTPLRYLGREDVGFTGDAFVLLRGRNLARARAQVAFEAIGATCEIICEKGLPEIPLLKPLLNTVMLARGVVPVHAAAFRYRGRGVLVTGWSHGSKTGSLLSFMADGADFVGDEWIYLCPNRERMYGLPDKIEVRPWYLQELPRYQSRVGPGDGMRLATTQLLANALAPFVPGSERRNSLAGKIIRHAHSALLDQQSIHFKPHTLFDPEACPLAAELQNVIVAVSHDVAQVVVEPTPAKEVAARMSASFLYEQGSLIACYQKHLFAFPDRRNELLDHVERVYCERALEAIAGKTTHTMYHPYPVSALALRRAIQPVLGLARNP